MFTMSSNLLRLTTATKTPIRSPADICCSTASGSLESGRFQEMPLLPATAGNPGVKELAGGLSGLSPSTPPMERESFFRIVELTIPKATTLSIRKRDCEKNLLRLRLEIRYSDVDSLFEDYRNDKCIFRFHNKEVTVVPFGAGSPIPCIPYIKHRLIANVNTCFTAGVFVCRGPVAEIKSEQ